MTGAAAERRPDDRTVVLAGPVDLDGFRRAARVLMAEQVAPDRLHWRLADAAGGGLFDRLPAHADGEGSSADRAAASATAAACTSLPDAAASAAPAQPPDDRAPPLAVPRGFARLAEAVVLHADPARFALLYQLLWRLQHEPALRADPLDPQWLRAERMAHAVQREQHKMKAFVRFRPIERGAGEPPLHVAWFEPEHHIVEAVAPFFARRFAQLQWSILTPLRSVAWDGRALHFAAGASPDEAPDADAGEALWLTYYRHIFNPARLKLAMMRKEMPRRYWNNLPEATLIQPLAAAAHARSGAMIAQPASVPQRTIRRPGASNPADGGAAALPLPTMTDRRSDDDRARELDATRAAARDCSRCPLFRQATQTVFGEGAVDARLMFVGEQPGDQEDLHGKPFVGPAGKLFAQALDEIGVDRSQAYVTNAVKHFKFELRGKRRIHKTPTQQEAAACLDWLEREIALVRPQAVIALGATAARTLLGRPVPVLRERGRWLARSDGMPVLVTLHPSALLRMPDEQRPQAWSDWLADLRVGIAGPR